VIAEALADGEIVEIMVNPDGRIWIDHLRRGRSFTGHTLSRDDAERIMRLLADHAGSVVTRDKPRISATLPIAGERFQGQFMPLVVAPAFTIRKRPRVIFTLADYLREGMVTAPQRDAILQGICDRANILIVGGTGSGKTTLANAILAEPQLASDRIVIIEDTAELQCSALDCVCLLTSRREPEVTMADLVRDTLRLRPDRIVVGEVRDGSALDLLKAWNTGHPGGLATIHANSAADGLIRLEELVGEVTQRIPHGAIARAVNLIIDIRRAPGGRRIRSVCKVAGWKDGVYALSEVG
jgi:type IV secretion system protein VirB11